ncbi:MAG: hypothetical protein K2K77_05285 [Duncaniella sp.]|nr:hypothetical protein [Duncaniella sp.]
MSEDGVTIGSAKNPWRNFKNIETYDFSGIEDIIADFDEDAPYEIYNLNGVKAGDNIDALSSRALHHLSGQVCEEKSQ